ncbi:transcription repressor NadR [Bacillus chungangensis]|uniref:Transcriptional regulator of NAD metabolism n=1 Tax=Bacillus chungangensis TaxID=587633 RepID=A0ABT9WMA3_9BACI|nr:transcription repressor NadR [Bacillus chungangensis]MDQ0174305.1 transcriptional regulator of NAD metabolism [Bacillus chungangensis]
MNKPKKILGEERRQLLLHVLKDSKQPITGAELAKMTNVSRQVIVGDITLLKARNEPIIATSQGYLYMQQQAATAIEKIITCSHPPEQSEEELNILVDHGLTVKDVKIEHPVYGDLTASIMVSNRKEVQLFMENIKRTNAAFLSELTDGIHLHTIIAKNQQEITAAENALKSAGILII